MSGIRDRAAELGFGWVDGLAGRKQAKDFLAGVAEKEEGETSW